MGSICCVSEDHEPGVAVVLVLPLSTAETLDQVKLLGKVAEAEEEAGSFCCCSEDHDQGVALVLTLPLSAAEMLDQVEHLRKIVETEDVARDEEPSAEARPLEEVEEVPTAVGAAPLATVEEEEEATPEAEPPERAEEAPTAAGATPLATVEEEATPEAEPPERAEEAPPATGATPLAKVEEEPAPEAKPPERVQEGSTLAKVEVEPAPEAKPPERVQEEESTAEEGPRAVLLFRLPDSTERSVELRTKDVGVGFKRSTPLVVKRVREDGGGARSGVQLGWKLRAINGEEVWGLPCEGSMHALARAVRALPGGPASDAGPLGTRSKDGPGLASPASSS